MGKKEVKQLDVDKFVCTIITILSYCYLNMLLCTTVVKLLF